MIKPAVSIQSKLIVLFLLLSLVPLAFVSFLAFRNVQQTIKENIGHKLEALALESIKGIDETIFLTKENIKALAKLEMMQDVIADDPDGRITDTLTRLKGEYGVFSGIFCINPQGKVIASSEPRAIGQDVSNEMWFQESFKKSEVSLRDLKYAKLVNGFALNISIPITSSLDQSKIGLLSARFNWSELYERINAIQIIKGEEQSGSGYAILINEKGSVISGPGFVFEAAEEEEEEEEILSRTNLIKMGFQSAQFALAGKEGFLIDKGHSERSFLIGYAGSRGHRDFKGFGWGALIMQDTRVAFTPVLSLRKKFMLMSLIVAMIVILLAIFISRRMSLSIQRLREMAVALTKGDLSHRVDIKSRDEIEILGKSLNRMAEDLQKSRNELISSKDYTDNIIRSMTDTLIVISPDGHIETVNETACSILGYKEQELICQLFGQVISEEKVYHGTKLAELVEKGSIVNKDVVYRAKDGRKIPMSLTSSVMRDRGGDVQGIVCVAQNITERKQAEKERLKLEAQIQQAQKMESLGVLAGGIAHDFNNILMGVIGYADLALTEISPGSPAQNFIREIVHSANRAAELSQQMLAYSGKGRFVIEKISLSEIVEEMGHLLESSVSKKAIIKYNFADELPAIEADVTQIRQIVMNLMINASEALGKKEGIVNISTGAMDFDRAYLRQTYLDEKLPEGCYAYLEISDTGCGMDKKTAEKIFDPFFSTKFTGRGLGLAALIGIVRGHRGAIKVESKPGEGTSIRVLFPALLEPAKPLTVPPAVVKGWNGSGTVLLIDDEDVVLEVAEKMLEKIGFKVLSARGGSEAIELLQQHNSTITCAILDLTMPHMDGDQVLEELHRIRGDLRVIISSGYSKEEIEDRLAGKHLSGFILKPYTIKNLTAIMKQVLMV